MCNFLAHFVSYEDVDQFWNFSKVAGQAVPSSKRAPQGDRFVIKNRKFQVEFRANFIKQKLLSMFSILCV